MEWITTSKLEVGDEVAFLQSGCVWRNRADAEKAPHGTKTVVANELDRRSRKVEFADGTVAYYAPAGKQLRTRSGAAHRVHAGDARFTFDEALHLVRCGSMNPSTDVDEAIARRMVNLDCCLWHACHLVYGEMLEDGRIPTDICTVCGGRNTAGHGDHGLCTARVRAGRTEIPRIDVVESRLCDCAACAADRKETAS